MCQPCVQAARKRVIRLKKEKQIQKVKTKNHLGYPEARRLVEGATPSPGAKTYAAASRVSTRTVDCQTDITWLSRERPLAMNSGKSQTPVSTHHSTDTQTTHSIPQTSAPTSAPPQTAQSPSRNAQHGRPQPGAGAVGSQSKPKKKPKMDRLPKGSSNPIAQANRFLLLPDDPGEVEMAEAAPWGNRSRSPKKKQRGPSPVVAPSVVSTLLPFVYRKRSLDKLTYIISNIITCTTVLDQGEIVLLVAQPSWSGRASSIVTSS